MPRSALDRRKQVDNVLCPESAQGVIENGHHERLRIQQKETYIKVHHNF